MNTTNFPRPHGRSAYMQACARAIEPTIFDIITDSIGLQIYFENQVCRVILDRQWFIVSSTGWVCSVDIFSRAGTSMVHQSYYFVISGQVVNGVCTPTGMEVKGRKGNKEIDIEGFVISHIDGFDMLPDEQQVDKSPAEEMDTEEKIKVAKRLIKSACSSRNYKMAFSGGKDSVVMQWLTKEAGVNVPAVYNNTTIDPPGTIPFVRKCGATVNRPESTFFQLVERKGYPTMFRRFCCEILKEQYISDYIMIGVRKSESTKRANNYCAFEQERIYNSRQRCMQLLPLLYFNDNDIEYCVNQYQLECHPLYYDGEGRFNVKKRLGCIACPLQGDRGRQELKERPKFLLQLVKAGQRFHERLGRTKHDNYLNLVFNLFYSNHGTEKYYKRFQGLFNEDPKEILENYFNVKLP